MEKLKKWDLPDGHCLIGIKISLALTREELIDLSLALELGGELSSSDFLDGSCVKVLHLQELIIIVTGLSDADL